MSYFSADDKYLAAQPQPKPQPEQPRLANEPLTARASQQQGKVNGYFRADENATRSADAALVLPWGLTVQAAFGQVALSWHSPYAAVAGFVVEGKTAGEWRQLGRCGAGQTQLTFDLAPGNWELRVGAEIQGILYYSAEVAHWNSLPVAPPAIPTQAYQPAPTNVQAQQVETRVVLRCPQPNCGAALRLNATGDLQCGYCGALTALGADNTPLALDTLLYGACSCCSPKRPLLRDGDALICLGRPAGLRYPLPNTQGPRANSVRQDTTAPTPELSWDAIDRALRDNSATLGVHGLFIHNQQRR